jgi:hypothetical protein
MEWHKVTPLSKFVALALFVALPFIGFWYGIRYGETVAYINENFGNNTPGQNLEAYYKNVGEWQMDKRDDAGFSVAYPLDFETRDIFYTSKPSLDWRLGAENVPGMTLFTLTIPKAFEPQTNFNEAMLVIGESRDARAVARCLATDPSGRPVTATTTIMIGGIPFTIFQSNGAGAGNFYETTGYRAAHNGTCWSLEYTIHSSQIMNYPESYHLKLFDKPKLVNLLDRVVGTFRFL